MTWHVATAAFALLGAAAAIQVAPASEPVPTEAGHVDSSKLRTRAAESVEMTQSIEMATRSEVLMGVPMLESDACMAQAENFVEGLVNRSEWKHMEPPAMPEAGKGARRRMYAIGGMEYELFLPKGWKNQTKFAYPVILYFSGYSERKWSMMNSQGLARLLNNNQSTSFSSSQCWCHQDSTPVPQTTTNEMTYYAHEAKIYEDSESTSVNTDNATDYTGPMADCSFAEKFKAIAIFVRDPQFNKPDWLGTRLGPDPRSFQRKLGPHYTTYGGTSYDLAKTIARDVITNYNGDADQVMVAGSLEGASAAVEMAKAYPTLFSAMILTDPVLALDMTGLDTMPVLVSSDKAMGETLNDALVLALKGRTDGASLTKYFRFEASPTAADPLMQSLNESHTADFVYKNPDVWGWAAKYYSGSIQSAKDFVGWERWGTPDNGYRHIKYNPTRPPFADSYNPTRPPIHG